MAEECSFSNAKIHWDDDQRPHSTVYGDIYFSRADAVGESTHVFLKGNQLPERWRQLQPSNFTIGELGFGAGLNFLNTCREWCRSAPESAQLHYLSCELHPFTLPDMHRMYDGLPQLQEFSKQLLLYYPDHTGGIHQLELIFGRHHISLTLLYGDAAQMLSSMEQPEGFKVDCWYLDGFSPKLNSAMWQPSLLQIIARLSRTGTTLSTYSVAGVLRHGLQVAGFVTKKIAGFASKRHMLTAVLAGSDQLHVTTVIERVTTHTKEEAVKSVCIIGAGLAGCSTAFALAQSGWQVLLLERESSIARLGSGNPQGILHYRPSKAHTAEREFNLHAYLYAVRHYRKLAAEKKFSWHACGMLQLAVTDKLLSRYKGLVKDDQYSEKILTLLEAEEASKVAGINLDLAGLYLPDSGWMSPPDLCAFYASHPRIELKTSTELVAMDYSSAGWQLTTQKGSVCDLLQFSTVILCNAADAYSFSQTHHYPLVCNLGQVDFYSSTLSSHLKTVLCGQGYILPTTGVYQSVGGSFFVSNQSEEASAVREKDHVSAVKAMNQEMAVALSTAQPIGHRIAVRCATPDRMPLVGPVTYDLSSATNNSLLPRGLYLNIAHGSHGLTRTPISAAYLASLLNNTPLPLSAKVTRVIRPDRF